MEAAWSYNSTTQHYNAEDFDLNPHCHKDLKSSIFPSNLILYNLCIWNSTAK